MFRSIVASAAVMTLAVGASAQTQLPAGNINKIVAPNHGTYNMTTGFEVSTQSNRFGPAVLFDNTSGVTYYYTGMTDTSEYVDEMAFAASDLDGDADIDGVSYSYCSATPDSGTNDVVTTELRFYDDTILGAGPTGWLDLGAGTSQNAACGYAVLVPGDTSGTGLSCWNVTVDLACGLECELPREATPGGFTEFNGMGWMYRDALASGGSGPFLDSLTGLGGPFTATPGYGSQDYFEWFDLAAGLGAEYQGAFFFGGGSKLQGSFDTVLFGTGMLDTDSFGPAAPDAGDILCLTSDVEFRTGSSVTWSLDAAGTAGTTYAMLVGTARADLNGVAGAGTTLLVDPGSLLMPPTPLGMSGSPPSVSTPTLPGLPGTVVAQAFGFVGGIGAGNATEASNGLEMNN